MGPPRSYLYMLLIPPQILIMFKRIRGPGFALTKGTIPTIVNLRGTDAGCDSPYPVTGDHHVCPAES
jgi:hypothetical protein